MIEVSYICTAGISIDNAWKKLQKIKDNEPYKGETLFVKFNDKEIYSTDTLDDAYLRIIGITKAEFDERRRKEYEEYLKEEAEHKAKIPQLTIEYINKAKGIIDDELMNTWAQIVPIRLGDLYHGMELDATLEIIKKLKETNDDFTEGMHIINSQDHSGMSYSLVLNMVEAFYEKGSEFKEYCR